jgi:hypothetical protein
MRKLLQGVLMLALVGSLVAPALAEDGDSKMTVHSEIWSRTEYLENFTDFTDSTAGGANNDNLDFTMYRARVGVDVAVTDEISASFEIQNFGVWGNAFPLDSNAQDPNLGTAQLTTDALGTNDTVLYQASIRLKNLGGSPLSLNVGRQEHTLGNELHMGDADFYGGQYFDGIRATLDFEAWDMDAFYYKVQERSLAPGSLGQIPPGTLNGGSDDSDLWGVTANFNLAESHNLEPYILYSRDGAELGTLSGPKYNAFTAGALYKHPRGEDGMLDWSLEAALQDGEMYAPVCPGGAPDCDLSSYIAEAEIGLSLGSEHGHRFAVGGLLMGDGDDASDIEAFMNLFPDTHRRAGAMDIFSENSSSAIGGDSFHNLTNYYLSYQHTGGNHSFGGAFHFFQNTEDFGFGEDELGQEVDLFYDFKYGEHVNVNIGLGQFMPGDLFTSPNDEDAMRGWAMLRFRG